MNSPAMESRVGGLSHLMEAANALAELTQLESFEEEGAASVDVKPEEEAESEAFFVVSDEEDRKKSASRSANSKRVIFPQHLLSILSDNSLSDVVTWLPHGRSFVIIRPDVFTEEVLPKYLPPVDARASTKYPSFTRKLNRWGFRQETRGEDTGAFHHPHFRRDQPSLCLKMICQRSRDRKSNSSNSPSSSHLPLKKRIHSDDFLSKKVAPLTKESLAAMAPPESQIPSARALATISVTDDTSSATSSNSSASSSSLSSMTLQPSISKDDAFVAGALKAREQTERARVAKAMLYQAFLQAMQAE